MVIDANLLVTMVSGDDRGARVFEQIATWIYAGVELHAPTLAQYEVINALTRLVVSKTLKAETAKKAWNDQSVLPIHYHSIHHPDRVIEIALSLSRQTAYDAAYLALAEELGTDIWTLDGPLYRNASQLGFPVRLLV